MKHLLFFLLLLGSSQAISQSLNAAQQEALNSYIEFSDEAKKHASDVVGSVASHYPEIIKYQKSKNPSRVINYRCPIQIEDYFHHKATTSVGLTTTDKLSLNAIANELKASTEHLDQQCKALEIYFSLEDYKLDQFAKYDSLVLELGKSVQSVKKTQEFLNGKVKYIYKIHQPYKETFVYQLAESQMLRSLDAEKKVLESWTYNLNESLNTGFPIDVIRKSITDTEKQLALLKEKKNGMGNYSITTFNDFIASLEEFQDTKRKAMDSYNFEAKKSDKHANSFYMEMINLYNGALVAGFNNFINLSVQHKFRGAKTAQFIPVYEIKTQGITNENTVTPFKDIPYLSITVTPQTVSIPAAQHNALNNYINFINESLSQTDDIRLLLMNFNSSAVYYKDLSTYKGKGGLTFNPSDFKIPQSTYQKLKEESINISPAHRKSLNNQAEVLMSILLEIEGLGVELHKQTESKLYEQDNLTKVYEIMERLKVLLTIVDDKKEQLYTDVRKIHQSYKVPSGVISWNTSAKELLKLIDLNKEVLFTSKKYFKGDSSSLPSTTQIDEQVRLLIANEYSNLKGIEKLGRYNGLCPYTPYEDIPKNSRTYSEIARGINSSPKAFDIYSYKHPYHDLIYLYNSFIDDYNKFSELAKMPILKNIHQPELFIVKYPDAKVAAHNAESEKIRLENERLYSSKTKTGNNEKQKDNSTGTKVIHDTIYVERNKVDTLILRESADQSFSMDGYAINNIVLLLDVSGSMNNADKLPLMKKSLERLLKIMRKEDEISIVIYSGEASVALPPTSCKESEKIIKIIQALRSNGPSNGNAGIKLAYKVADENYLRGGNNRIILATDGEFPVNKESIKLIEKYAL
jgi:Mg-chelatase subunit ChlD